MSWITANLANILILAALAAIVGLIVRSLVRNRGAACSGCSGCSGCPSAGGCAGRQE